MKHLFLVLSLLCFCLQPVSGQFSQPHDLAFWAINPQTAGQIKAADWAARVVANGGAMPGGTSITAAGVFVDCLIAAGLDTSMISVNFFAPDNLIACLTPLYKVAGADPWVNNNFVLGDITADGIKGDGSTKWINTQVDANTAFANDNSAGLTLFVTDGNNVMSDDMGNHAGFALYASYAGTSFFDCWNEVGGRVQGSEDVFGGFISGNRTSATASAIYVASGGQFATLVNGTGQSSIGTRPSGANNYVYVAAQSSSGSGAGPTTRRYSFAAVHLGFNSSQAQAFYNCIQTLNDSLGRWARSGATFTTTSGLLNRIESSTFSNTLQNASVTSWADQSGNANNWSQADGTYTQAPKLVWGMNKGGYPTVRFKQISGNNSTLSTSTLWINNGYTGIEAYCVFKVDTFPPPVSSASGGSAYQLNRNGVFGGDTPFNDQFFYDNTGINAQTKMATATSPDNAANWCCYHYFVSTTAVTAYVNTTQIANAIGITPNLHGNESFYYLGNSVASGVAGNFSINGNIASLYVWGRLLSGAEQTTMSNYVFSVWGVAVK